MSDQPTCDHPYGLCAACLLCGHVETLPRWTEALPDDETTWPRGTVVVAFVTWTGQVLPKGVDAQVLNDPDSGHYVTLDGDNDVWPVPGLRLFWQPFPEGPEL